MMKEALLLYQVLTKVILKVQNHYDFVLRYVCNNYGDGRVHDTVQVHKPGGQLKSVRIFMLFT